MQTPETLVQRNVRSLREQRRHTVRSLSAQLDDLGRPDPAVWHHEDRGRLAARGRGRPDAALAVALRVHPNRLLLADDDGGGRRRLHASVVPMPDEWVWAWGRGDRIPLPMIVELYADKKAASVAQVRADFRRDRSPAFLRDREDHTAVRAAEDVIDRVRTLIRQAQEAEAAGLGKRPYPAMDDSTEGVAESDVELAITTDHLRRALAAAWSPKSKTSLGSDDGRRRRHLVPDQEGPGRRAAPVCEVRPGPAAGGVGTLMTPASRAR